MDEGSNSELLFARDAMRIAIATERSGLEFYTRGARLVIRTGGQRKVLRVLQLTGLADV